MRNVRRKKLCDSIKTQNDRGGNFVFFLCTIEKRLDDERTTKKTQRYLGQSTSIGKNRGKRRGAQM